MKLLKHPRIKASKRVLCVHSATFSPSSHGSLSEFVVESLKWSCFPYFISLHFSYLFWSFKKWDVYPFIGPQIIIPTTPIHFFLRVTQLICNPSPIYSQFTFFHSAFTFIRTKRPVFTILSSSSLPAQLGQQYTIYLSKQQASFLISSTPLGFGSCLSLSLGREQVSKINLRVIYSCTSSWKWSERVSELMKKCVCGFGRLFVYKTWGERWERHKIQEKDKRQVYGYTLSPS